MVIETIWYDEGILGGKLGYNSCPYLSFFYPEIRRLKIFVSTWLKTLKYKTNPVFGPKMPCKHLCIWMHMNGTKETQSSIGDATWNVETKEQSHQENKSLVNHKKRIREEDNKHRRSLPMYYQRSLKVERENISYHRRSLMMNYQCSLKIAKR